MVSAQLIEDELKVACLGTADLEVAELLSLKTRRDVLAMLMHRGYGHVGGSLSIVELLAVLYAGQLRHNPQDPHWEGRDRIVLSKGHAGPALYSVLAERGFFPREWLDTLNDGGTHLPSHTDRTKTPGVDATTGSLGQGTSQAAGIAAALELKGSDAYTFLIVGDGELNEGQCWEAFQYIAARPLSRCIVIIDDNKKQLDGPCEEILKPFDYVAKMQSFGFYTQKVQGADMAAIDAALTLAKHNHASANCIVLDSTKGQGVAFFENAADNHSMKWSADDIKDATTTALAELDARIAEIEA